MAASSWVYPLYPRPCLAPDLNNILLLLPQEWLKWTKVLKAEIALEGQGEANPLPVY